MTRFDKLRSLISSFLDFEFWIVGSAVVISVIWTDFLPAAILIALVFWLLRGFSRGHLSIRTPMDLSIGLLCFMVFCSLVVTSLPGKTLPQVYRVVLGVLFFYSVVNWTNSIQRLSHVIFLIILAGLLIALISPLNVTWSTSKLLFIPRAFYERFNAILSDTVHPNVMGGNLILVLPLPLSILVFGWKQIRWRARFYLGFSILVMALVILLTKSRGTWIALTAVVILIILLRWRINWILIVLGTGILFVSIFLIGFTDFIDILTANDALIGIEGRIDIWSRAVLMIQDFPITGIGLGTFMDLADNLYRFFLFPAGKIIHAHNLFLQIAVDIGLPGLIAWLSIFLSFCWINWKIFRHGANQGNSLESGLGVGLLGSSLALAIHGLTDAVTWGFIRTAPMVWVLWGVSLAIYFIGQKPAILMGSISRSNDRFLQEQEN